MRYGLKENGISLKTGVNKNGRKSRRKKGRRTDKEKR